MCVCYFLDLGKLLIYLSLPPKKFFGSPITHLVSTIYKGQEDLNPETDMMGPGLQNGALRILIRQPFFI